MTHEEFVSAYQSGTLRVNIDRVQAARFVSARLMLPLFMLPVLGTGVALALIGWIWTGLIVIGVGTIAPMLIKRSAPHFVLTQALQDARFYDDAAACGLLQFEPPDTGNPDAAP
jgi:hypothetical protein